MSYCQDILTLDSPKTTRAPDYPVAMSVFNGLLRYQATSSPGLYCVFDQTRLRTDLRFTPRYDVTAAIRDASADLRSC